MSAIASLLALLVAPLKRLTGPALHKPTRVGLLNTNELVLVDQHGNAQVLSAATTAVIREQLIHTDFAASELLLCPCRPSAGGDHHAGR